MQQVRSKQHLAVDAVDDRLQARCDRPHQLAGSATCLTTALASFFGFYASCYLILRSTVACERTYESLEKEENGRDACCNKVTSPLPFPFTCNDIFVSVTVSEQPHLHVARPEFRLETKRK